jgi:pyruvate formate lyase activating enzyme
MMTSGVLAAPELTQELPGGKVRCMACARYCTIPEGSHGFCFVRANEGGRLRLLTYGRVAAIQVDPVEKKPLSHFHPGSRVFGIGTVGCNWRCAYCQNWQISQEREAKGRPLSPEQAVSWAKREGCAGVTFTYNEPSIFAEYASDVMAEAHRAGLFANFVTNGYLTPEAVGYLGDRLDAISVDLKGSAEPGFLRRYVQAKGPEPILESLGGLNRKGVHVEVTDLIVPKVGDDPGALRKVARFLVDEMGPDVPFHLLRFHPDYHMMDLPETPIRTLEALHAIAREEGLRYVYLGNVWGHPLEHTYCPRCQAVAVERFGYFIRSWNLDEGNRCRECGNPIPIVGRPPPEYEPRDVLPLA